MKRSLIPLATVLLLAAQALTVAAAEPDAGGLALFETKIRPVLVRQCYQCHSAAAQQNRKLKGGLLLDTRDGIRQGGNNGPAVVPGKVEQSLLLKAIRHETVKMPPKGRLPDAVVADFAQWIKMGAPDPREAAATVTKKPIDLEAGRRFWSFQPLGKTPPPVIQNTSWARTPIDRFILARLEEQKLTPNAQATRERLLRRICYDLTGLPPTPAEVDAFLNDTSPGAYERLVDRLLDSQHYGERWARHWLDVARFAESGGYEFDRDRPGAHHYRDFVIRALNEDMPFDRFVRWQLAGDQLLPGDFRAAAATGFVVAGPYPGQTTAKTQELIRYDHLDDMLSTLGNAMLGLTLGCARCHDHKYDPIPQQDYYRLLATLARTDSADLKMDPTPEVYRKAKAEFDRAHAPLLAARDRFEKEELPQQLHTWLEGQKSKPLPSWLILDAVSANGLAPLEKLADGSLQATGRAGRTDTYTIVAHTYQKGIRALRLDALAATTLPRSGPGRGPDGRFVLTAITVTAAPLVPDKKNRLTPVKLRAVRAILEQPGQPLAAALKGDRKNGWSAASVGKDDGALFELEPPVGFDGGTVLTVTLKFESGGYAIGRPRLSISTAPALPGFEASIGTQSGAELLTVLAAEQGKLTPRNRQAVARWFFSINPRARVVSDAVDQHARQEPKPSLVPIFAAAPRGNGTVYFLTRGEPERKNGLAQPGFLQVLRDAAEGDAYWTKRLAVPGGPALDARVALADWLTDVDHGAGRLLARVIVNRLWQHHLGRGIVATPNDFGAQGIPPTHPELLDWLAGELIRGGWRLKPIQRLIVTSAVYTQSSAVNTAALRVDPDNHLCWRQRPRRLEAEAIRDALLAVGGNLDQTLYGPSTLSANTPRRSIYLMVKRSQPLPLLQMFDAPEPIQSIGERPTTTVATQALALMNSPFVRQQAEKLAQRIRPKSPDVLPQAIDEAYGIALTRRPSPAERERMVAFVRQQLDDPRALDRALADACQVLLCLNEFVYVD